MFFYKQDELNTMAEGLLPEVREMYKAPDAKIQFWGVLATNTGIMLSITFDIGENSVATRTIAL